MPDVKAVLRLHEANRREKALLAEPSIDGFLPFKFSDTGFCIQSLNFCCSVCGENIALRDIHGTNSNLVARVLDLDLIGVCSCGVATPYRIRVHSNRWCDWLNSDGSWQHFKVYAPTWIGVRAALKDLRAVVGERFLGHRGKM